MTVGFSASRSCPQIEEAGTRRRLVGWGKLFLLRILNHGEIAIA